MNRVKFNMEKEKDILTSLFEQARNEKLETSHREVYRWIGYFSLLSLFGVWLSKIKLLFTKSFIMYTYILTSAAVIVGTIAYNFTGSNQTQSESLNLSDSLSKTKTKVIEEYAQPRENAISKHAPHNGDNILTSPNQEVEVTQPMSQTTSTIQESPIQENPANRTENVQVVTNDEFNDYGVFDNINVSGSARVVLVQGNSYGARIEGNAAEVTLKTVKGVKTLVVSSSSVGNNNRAEVTVVYVTAKDLKTIITSDAARVSSDDIEVEFDQLAIESHDASRVDLKLKSKNLSINCSDASRVTLSGSTNDLTVVSSDASRLSAFELQADAVNALGKDASRLEVFASKELNITLHDASRLEYMGNPKSINQLLKGASKVVKVG